MFLVIVMFLTFGLKQDALGICQTSLTLLSFSLFLTFGLKQDAPR